MDILFSKRTKASEKPWDCITRYLVIKHSWRGSYRRLLCITPDQIFTQDPQQSFRITNSYSTGPDADIDGLTLGPGPEEFSLLARSDKKSRKFSAVKFSCRQRAALLTDLYQCMVGVTALSNAGLAYKLLSSSEHFQGSMWSSKDSTWVEVTLQVACFELTCLGPNTGAVLWRVQYQHLCSPAFSLLANSPKAPPPSSSSSGAAPADAAADAHPHGAASIAGVFAVHVAGRRRPKLLSCMPRDTMLGVLRTQALKRLGLEVAVNTSIQHHTAHEMLQAVAQADAQVVSVLCESPLSEWEVSSLLPRHDLHPALAQLSTPHLLARPLSTALTTPGVQQDGRGVGGGAHLVSRRLVLTSSHLVERQAGSYSLVGAKPLTAVANLVRFTEDPQLLAVEWVDRSPPSLFLSPSRDAILSAVLDAGQTTCGAPIPVLPGLTAAGDDVAGVVAVAPTPAALPSILPSSHAAAPIVHANGGVAASQRGAAAIALVVPHRATGLLSAKSTAPAADQAAAKEVVRWLCDELVGRARDAYAVLNTSSRNFFSADIDFKAAPQYTAMDIHHAPHDVLPAIPPPPSPHMEGSAPAANTTASHTPDAAAAAAAAADLANGVSIAGRTAPAAVQTTSAAAPALGSTAAEVLGRGAVPPSAAGGAPSPQRVSLFGSDQPSRTGLQEAIAVREAMEVMMECIAEFCCCVPYAGVPQAFRLDANAAVSLLALLPPELQPGLAATRLPCDDSKQAVLVLQCLQRVAASHQAAHTLLAAPGAIGRIMAAVACGDEHVASEACRLLLRCCSPHTARLGAMPWRALRGSMALMGTPPPNSAGGGASSEEAADAALHSSTDDLDLAKTAKALCFPHTLLASRVTQLLAPLVLEQPGCSPLLSLSIVELVAACVCEPGSATTESKLMTTLLTECAGLGRPLFALFHHPATRVGDGVAVLMRAIAESGTAAAAPMREAALREGAMLHHLLLAVSPALHQGTRTHLSRDLVASWADEYAPALTLLRRVLPAGLIRHLNIPKQPRAVIPLLLPAPAPPGPTAAGTAGVLEAQSAAALVHPVQAIISSSPGAPAQPPNQTQGAVGSETPQDAAAGLAGAAPGPPGQDAQASSNVPQAGQARGPAPTAAAAGPPLRVPSPAPPGGPASHAGSGPATPKADGSAAPQPPQPPPSGAPPLPPSLQGAPATTQTPAATGAAAGAAGAAGGVQHGAHMLQIPVTGGLRGNWQALWEAIGRDHCHAGLVWDEACRRELREALQAEEAQLRARRRQVAFQAHSVAPTWNHAEFRVTYPSLAKHTCIGGIYIRLLLDGADTAAVSKVAAPRDLFQALHHHLMCSDSHLLHAHASSLSSSGEQQRQAALQSSALSEVESVQLLCVRAMTEVYHVHAGAVGPMEGLPHLMRLLDLSLRRPLRHHLLLLMAAALQPRSAQTSMQAHKAAKANAVCVCDEGGVQLLVDLAAAAHEAADMELASITGAATGKLTSLQLATPAAQAAAAAAPVQYLTGSSAQEGPKEWYYYPAGVTTASSSADKRVGQRSQASEDGPSQEAGVAEGEELGAPDATGRIGPVSKGEVLQLWREGKVHGHTLFWAEGCAAPMPLAGIRELRWLVSGGPPVLSVREAAHTALGLLVQLAQMQPATDEAGSVLQPLPRVLRILATPRCLSHISQLLLTRDPQLVSQACGLMQVALAHNEDVLARLYRTGFFYFALSYAGSNLGEIAALLAVSHLKQAHRGAAHSPPPGAPLAARSYLGHLLPESLLYYLDTYGPQAFATALCGDTDSPELRWTHSMRWGRLIPQLTTHLGDLPHRLAQNWGGVVWPYTPAPPITYPELQGELWCHRYYLRSLCDEVAFPDFHILDHVQLLQALLAEWKAELSRQPLSLSESDACQVLGLQPGAGGVVLEEDMRKAYRLLARKYHPDKNPAGRAMFLKVQQAYERLQAGAAGGQGPQPWRLMLIIKAQCILFRRFKSLLAPYKYAGYPMLLEVLSSLQASQSAVPASQGAGDAAPAASSTTGAPGSNKGSQDLTQVACELCWRTVCTSHLNADELARCGGVAITCTLLQRLAATGGLRADASPTSHESIIATHLLRSLAGFAASDTARAQLAAVPGLLPDLVRACSLTRAHAAAEAALVAVGHLCASPQLQVALLQEAHVYAHLIPLLFWYDSTVPDDDPSGSASKLVLPFTMPASDAQASTAPQVLPAPGSSKASLTGAANEAVPNAGTLAGGTSGATAAAGGGGGGGGGAPSPVVHSLSVLESQLVRSNEGRAHNYRAMLAAQVVACVAGVLAPPFHTPGCIPAQQALGALLTHGLAIRLRDPDPRQLLDMLSSGQETAQIIWNTSMRDELLSLLSDIRSQPPHTGPAAASQPDAGAGASLSHAVEQLLAWRYSTLQGELQVGGVYVRVFCANPAVLPQDVPGFCKALVRYLYDVFVTSLNSDDDAKHPSRLLSGPAPTTAGGPQQEGAGALPDVLRVLCALGLLVDAEPRLLGLLASKSALSPLVSALQVAEAHAFASSQAGDTPTSAAPQAAMAPLHGQAHQDTALGAAAPGGSGGGSALQGSLVPAAGAGVFGPAAELAQAVMQVMSKLVSHAGCMEALSDVATLRVLFHTAHCAPSPMALRQALGLLRALAGQPAAGVPAADQAGALYLLSLLLHVPGTPWPWPGGVMPGGHSAEEATLQEVAGLLAKLMGSPTHGTAISLQLQRLLPPALVTAIGTTQPGAVLGALHSRVSNPELVWDQQMAGQAAAQVTVLAHQARTHQARPGAAPGWLLPAGLSSSYQQLAGELRVGGVYCRLFLKDPQFPLSEPLKFGEGLAEALTATLAGGAAAAAAGGAGQQQIQGGGLQGSDLVVFLSACAVALLQHHLRVADTLTAQGYVGRLLALLAARLPAPQQQQAGTEPGSAPPSQPQGVVDEGGALLRLLHVLAASNAACEALAAAASGLPPGYTGAVAVLAGARAWGSTAEVLVLETLKRSLTRTNRSRDLLVQQALQVGLVPSLLARLDWQGSNQVAGGGGDVAVLRALAVDVLEQLAAEGAHGQQVAALLDASPVWGAYRGQRHDLFLPSGAAAAGSVAGLLTGPTTHTFALPAPERVNSDSGAGAM